MDLTYAVIACFVVAAFLIFAAVFNVRHNSVDYDLIVKRAYQDGYAEGYESGSADRQRLAQDIERNGLQ